MSLMEALRNSKMPYATKTELQLIAFADQLMDMTKRQADEIDRLKAVTPEMIDAGAKLIAEHFFDVVDKDSALVRELAAEVYRAMAMLAPGDQTA